MRRRWGEKKGFQEVGKQSARAYDKRQLAYFGNYRTFSGQDIVCEEESSERLGWRGKQGQLMKTLRVLRTL